MQYLNVKRLVSTVDGGCSAKVQFGNAPLYTDIFYSDGKVMNDVRGSTLQESQWTDTFQVKFSYIVEILPSIQGSSVLKVNPDDEKNSKYTKVTKT